MRLGGASRPSPSASSRRAVSDAKDLHDRIPFIDRGGEDVEVVALVRMYLLSVERPLDGHQAIAQTRGAFVRERIGCLLHLLPRVAGEVFVAAFEEEDALFYRRAVLVARRVPYARRGAPFG